MRPSQLISSRVALPMKLWGSNTTQKILTRAFDFNTERRSNSLYSLSIRKANNVFYWTGRNYSSGSSSPLIAIESEPTLKQSEAFNTGKESSRSLHEPQSRVSKGREEAEINPARPKRNEAKKKQDGLQNLLRSFPEDTNPRQILKAFAEKNGTKASSMFTYSHMIHIYSLSGESKRAQAIFDMMLADGMLPDERAYESLMNAYSNAGNLNKTIEIFLYIRNHPNHKSIYPYSILIKAYMRHRQVKDAFDVVELLKEKMSPNPQIYTILIQTCVEANDVDQAWVAYDMMLKDGCRPDSGTYSFLIMSTRKKDLKMAMSLFDEMLKQGVRPTLDCIHLLFSELANKPEYFSALLDLLSKLVSKVGFRPSTATFGIVMRGATLSRNLKYARFFFDKACFSRTEFGGLLPFFSDLFEVYSLEFPIDSCERSLPPIPNNNTFAYLQKPTPTCIEACAIEAMMTIPFLETVSTNKSIEKSRPWVLFLCVLANYNYFDAAIKHFEIFSKKFDNGLLSQSYISMLSMCFRLRKGKNFLDILDKTEPLLAPISPTSTLSKIEKAAHKCTYHLGPRPLGDLYQTIIIGLAEFDNLTKALGYFEAMSKDTNLQWWKNQERYTPFFDAIRSSSDPSLVSRLNSLITQ